MLVSHFYRVNWVVGPENFENLALIGAIFWEGAMKQYCQTPLSISGGAGASPPPPYAAPEG